MHFRAFLLFCCILISTLHGQVRPITFGGGTTSYDGWIGVNAVNFSGYGSFPGFSSWPNPILSNVDGSGKSSLNRIAGSPTGGGPFLGSASIYFGNFSQATNAMGGTMRITNASPLASVRTLILQIQIGEALGYDFYHPTGYPILKINGGTNGLSPSYPRYLLSRFQSGTFPSPATGQNEPIYVNTWIFQWNLADDVTVGSFAIDFSCVTHSQVYEIQLDQASAVVSSQITPTASTEPPRISLLTIASPEYNATNNTTKIRPVFSGPLNTALDIEYCTDLSNPSWSVTTNVLTTTGTFTNTISATGDLRALWAGKMFFRAKYSGQ